MRAFVRRIDGPPRAVGAEILRTALIDRLAERWDVPVTTVVAGPGFGKSTALAQAVRLHAAEPRGLEAWVTCEPGDEDARRLAGAICRAFGVDAPALAPLDTVLEALRAASPIESCLILDDVHEVARDSSGHRLIAELVPRLPAGAHLVLAGRALPPLPLARLHAAERIRCLREPDLAFGAGELDRVASNADRPVADVTGLGGWPALVRLTLAAPAGIARDYLWEEVVSGLSPADRDVLLHLAVLGSADAPTLYALAGVTTDLDLLAERVPLVARFGDGRIRAHPLWTRALVRLLPADRVATARARAADLLLERGDALRAGTIAITAGDVALLDRAATELVASTLATFPHDTGVRWLDAVPECEHTRPGLRLLTAATRYASRADDLDVDPIVDAAARAARENGDARTETAALSLATIAAHARGDESRLAELFQEALELPGADREPTLRTLLAGVRGAIFELMGSIEDALSTVEALTPADIEQQPGKIIVRFHVYLLILAGRADEAAEIAEAHLACSPYAHVRRMPQFARWMAGRPADLLPAADRAGDKPLHLPEADANDRYRFNFLAFAAVVAASQGDRAALRHVSEQLDASGLGDDTRDAAMLAVAAAAKAVLLGDETAAGAAITDFIADHPLSDPVAAVHLRRFLAYGYVLSPEARQVWDAQPLGPSHLRVRTAARLLLAARAGRLADALSPPAEAGPAPAASESSGIRSALPVVSGASSALPAVSGASSALPAVSGASSALPAVSGASSGSRADFSASSALPADSRASSTPPAVSGARSSLAAGAGARPPSAGGAGRPLSAAAQSRCLAGTGITPETVLISFPLPWSVELAAHAEAAGLAFGRELLQWLVDRLGRPAHDVLSRLATDQRAEVAAGARRLLAAVPATPDARIRVEVLGPLRVLVDGAETHPAGLRRRRVRQLLTLLAVHGEMDRSRLMDLLWPNLDPDAAARNLRVTLTYLRRIVDGHLRADRGRVLLVRSEALSVDVAELREHLDEARRARTRGDPAAADAALAAAVRLWRGEPLADLTDHTGLAAALLAELTQAALTLGERRLAQGDTTVAGELARRAFAAQPYAERCMRLLLAVETHRRDPSGLERAVRRVREALAALGAAPEPATAIVLRQAHVTRARVVATSFI